MPLIQLLKTILLIPVFLVFFQDPLGADTLPVSVRILTNNSRYPAELKVLYQSALPGDIENIIISNRDFSQYSVLAQILSIQSNAFILSVKSYEISNFTIPPLTVILTTPEGRKSLTVPEIPILMGSGTNFTVRSTAPPENIFVFIDPAVWIIIIILAAVVFIVLKIMKGKSSREIPGVMTSVNPFERALEELTRLEGTVKEGKSGREAYLRIWEIVRGFTETVFQFPALEMSTSEINREFRNMDASDEMGDIADTLQHILKTCDRVKYAKFRPSADQLTLLLAESFELIRNTHDYFNKTIETASSAGEKL